MTSRESGGQAHVLRSCPRPADLGSQPSLERSFSRRSRARSKLRAVSSVKFLCSEGDTGRGSGRVVQLERCFSKSLGGEGGRDPVAWGRPGHRATWGGVQGKPSGCITLLAYLSRRRSAAPAGLRPRWAPQRPPRSSSHCSELLQCQLWIWVPFYPQKKKN